MQRFREAAKVPAARVEDIVVSSLSDSAMYDEITEVQDELRLSDWDIDFLESIEGSARDDDLSTGRREQLERIYEIACRSRY